ncbi:MAG: alginate export family protein, partial [Nitrospirae bacterium]|nr:alginate export family protein [Nitrospirota bacterium]
VRLNVDAKVSDSVEGYVELESGDNTHDTYTWGANATPNGPAGVPAGATGVYPAGNTKEGSLYLRQAWLQYSKDQYGLKVGHQLLKLGNSLFFDHTKFGDDAILVFANPVKNLTLAALTARFQERSQYVNDDSSDYTILAVYKGENYNISGDVSFVNDQGFANLVPSYSKAHVWNFGIRGDATFANVVIRPDLEIQAGKFIGITKVPDATVKGWSWMFGLDYKLEPAVLTLEAAQGSGKKSTTTDFESYITSLGSDQHYTFVYEYRMKAASGTIGTGVANTTYIKGGANANFTKDLSGEMYLYWLRATEAVALNSVSALKDSPSHNLGWELDAKVSYMLAKNLKYYIEGGYMWVGDAYNYAGIGKNDAYGIRNGIQLNF